MAKLNAFRVDSRAKEEGQWVSPGEEYGDLEIRTRGLTYKYHDARNAKMRAAARIYGGDVTQVPLAKTTEIITECLIQHTLLDVRNLEDETGEQVDFQKFCELLRNPDYTDLYGAAIRAAAIVGLPQADDLEDAKKN